MDYISRYAPAGARVLLGLVFFVFGLNFFLHFIPQPPHEGPSLGFLTALFDSGYVMQLVKVVEVGAGALLLLNVFVPLALALLAPIVVNIVGFHLVLEPTGAPIALTVLALTLYLAYVHRSAYAPLLRARTEPSAKSTLEERLVHARV